MLVLSPFAVVLTAACMHPPVGECGAHSDITSHHEANPIPESVESAGEIVDSVLKKLLINHPHTEIQGVDWGMKEDGKSIAWVQYDRHRIFRSMGLENNRDSDYTQELYDMLGLALIPNYTMTRPHVLCGERGTVILFKVRDYVRFMATVLFTPEYCMGNRCLLENIFDVLSGLDIQSVAPCLRDKGTLRREIWQELVISVLGCVGDKDYAVSRLTFCSRGETPFIPLEKLNEEMAKAIGNFGIRMITLKVDLSAERPETRHLSIPWDAVKDAGISRVAVHLIKPANSMAREGVDEQTPCQPIACSISWDVKQDVVHGGSVPVIFGDDGVGKRLFVKMLYGLNSDGSYGHYAMLDDGEAVGRPTRRPVGTLYDIVSLAYVPGYSIPFLDTRERIRDHIWRLFTFVFRPDFMRSSVCLRENIVSMLTYVDPGQEEPSEKARTAEEYYFEIIKSLFEELSDDQE